MQSKRLVVIDGYSLLYRAFFATRFLSTTDGRPTNALFGFTSMLFNLLETIKPTAMVVALDAPGKTFRHAEYSEYKGTRRETAEELKVQFPVARELIAALGIPSIEVTGYEADDVVGTISKLAEANGYDTTIVTGDLDSLQLVDDCVSVLTTRQGVSDTVTYTPAAVLERYGFGPEHIADFKALKGDPSDNIKGVPGIGDKGATEIIQKFGSVEEVAARLSELDPKYLKKIEGNVDAMLQSKWLATIVRDVPLEYDFKPFVLSQAQMDAAKAMLESFEFKSHLRRADAVLGRYLEGADLDAPEVAEVQKEAVEISVRKSASLDDLVRFVDGRRAALFFPAPPPKIDLFDDPERLAYVAIDGQVSETAEAHALALLQRAPNLAIVHDAKPLYRSFPKGTAAVGFDTLMAGFVLQSGRSAYGLRDLISGYLDVALPTKPEEMAAALFLLHAPMSERLEKEGQTSVFQDIELPLEPILADMENIGIRADRESLIAFSKQLEISIELTAAKIYDYADGPFTIGSPKQLGEVLFDKLKIPGATKTKTGYATGAEVLQLLAPTHEIAAEVMNWRELSKLKSTYADALEKLIRPDGRIHTTYNQAGVATGRLSSVDPNLQNIPIRTELGRGIRKAFVAGDGFRLASFDYSQIELRVLAHMCGEPALVSAFADHDDVHTATARQMFNLGESDPAKNQRRVAKMLNYAVLYGVTDFGLAQQLGGEFSRAEAKELITLYNERFPTVRDFTRSVVVEARSKGFTTTLCGRRRYFPDIHAAKVMERQYAERQAMNAPLQGTAADMIKLAMIKVHARLQGTRSRLLLSVHDELLIELADGEEGLVEPIRRDMEQALSLNVPVEVDAKIGADWNDMAPVGRPK